MRLTSAARKIGKVLALVAGIAGSCLWTQGAHANPGDLDVTFGGDGIVERSGSLIATYPDARTLVGLTSGNGPNRSMVVERLTQSGRADLSFGSGGRVVIAFPGYDATPSGIAIQADGRIIVAGTVCGLEGCHFAAARLLSTGQYDSTFAWGGKIVVPIGEFATASSLVIDPLDGGILLAGFAIMNSERHDFALLRLTPSGWPDPSFGNGGKASTYFGNLDSYAYSHAVQSTGRIVLAGTAGDDDEYDMALARFNRNGSLDTSFGHSGKVLTRFVLGSSTGNSRALTIALQSNDDIIVGGFAGYDGVPFGGLIRRYTKDGLPDASFNGGASGLVLASPISVHDIGVQRDNKIVGIGPPDVGSPGQSVAFRLRSWGLLDTGFANLGHRVVGGSLYDVVVQSSGCIMLGGPSMVVRLVGDPPLVWRGEMPSTKPCSSKGLVYNP